MTSFDVNYRPLLWGGDAAAAAQAVAALLPVIDLLKVSEEELFLFGGRDSLLAAARQHEVRSAARWVFQALIWFSAWPRAQ